MILRELLALSESKPDPEDFFEFGFIHKPNAEAAEKVLNDAGIKFQRDENFGIHYFFFDDALVLKKAIKLVTPAIDTSKEDEWN